MWPVRRALPLLLCTLILLCIFTPTAQAQTDLRAWYADGQTWIVWEDTPPTPFTYDIYRSENPIDDLASAELIGRLYPQDYTGARLRIGNPDAYWRVPDGSGGEYVLDPLEGLFVFTPYEAVPEYFAVVKHGETAVGPGNAVGPVAQAIETVRCHYQYTANTGDGRVFSVYAHWIDGRSDDDGGRDDYPVMGNETMNGTGHVFAATEPSDGRPGYPMPLIVTLHGGGTIGSYADYGDRLMTFLGIGMDSPDAMLLAPDDCLFMYRETDPDVYEVGAELTRWLGYWSGLNRFEVPTGPPPDDAVVVSYTMRRLDFILDWFVANEDIDPNRVSLYGFSGGGSGAGFFARLHPEKISAVTMLVPPVTGSVNPHAVFLQGRIDQNLDTNIGEGIGVRDWYWPTTFVSDEEMPFMRYLAGRLDIVEAWAEKVEAFTQINDLRLGAHIYWDVRDHSIYWTGMHWTGDPSLDPYGLAAFRNDRSFPAFSNDDQNLLETGRQPDLGDGGMLNGDLWGTWGGFLGWDLSTIIDESNRWEATVYLISSSEFAHDVPDFEICETDVSIRRPQNFLPSPATTLYWSNTLEGKTKSLQTGTVAVSDYGLVTMGKVLITKTPSRLRISTQLSDDDTDDTSDDFDDDSEDDTDDWHHATDDTDDDTVPATGGGGDDDDDRSCCG